MDKRNKILSFVLALALLVLPSAAAFAATTIGNNVSVGGTLGSTGLSTLTGGFLSNASSTIAAGGLTVSGMLNASSGIMISGGVNYTGSLAANANGACGANGCFVVDNAGNINASGTLAVGKPSATTTVNIGNLGNAASMSCFNIQSASGTRMSFYILGGDTKITVENNACR